MEVGDWAGLETLNICTRTLKSQKKVIRTPVIQS